MGNRNLTKDVTDIANSLLEKGYHSVDSEDLRMRPYNECFRESFNPEGEFMYVDQNKSIVMGILKPLDPIQRKFLGMKWKSAQKPLYVGRLWLQDEDRTAKIKEKWILESYGVEQAPKLKETVKNIAQDYQVKVENYLCDNLPLETLTIM